MHLHADHHSKRSARIAGGLNVRREKMTTFKTIAAALVLSAAAATSAFAQAAVQEPGAYAFYHPNADVLNAGRPAADAFAAARVGDTYAVAPHRVRHHRRVH
jgi:hypothetical protein